MIGDIKNALDSAINATAATHSHGQQFSRQRKLTLAAMLRLLIGAEGGSLGKIAREAGVDVTPAALSQRRAQIEPGVFREVFNRFNADCTDNETFRGYRVLAVDGTAVNMPRNPAAPSFVCNDSAPTATISCTSTRCSISATAPTSMPSFSPSRRKTRLAHWLKCYAATTLIAKP